MEKLKKQNKWYNFYTKLPMIIMLFLIFFAFVWGIVDTTALDGTIIYDYDEGDGGLNWFLWQLIIDTFAVMTYVVMKIAMSATVMKVELLKAIAKKQGAIE